MPLAVSSSDLPPRAPGAIPPGIPLIPARPGDAPVRAAAAGDALGLFDVARGDTDTPGAPGPLGLPGVPRCGLPGLPGVFGAVLGAGVVEAGVVDAGVVESCVVDDGSVLVDSGVPEVVSEGWVVDGVVESSVGFVPVGFELGDDGVPEGFPLFVPCGLLPLSTPFGFAAGFGRGITGTFVSDSITTGA